MMEEKQVAFTQAEVMDLLSYIPKLCPLNLPHVNRKRHQYLQEGLGIQLQQWRGTTKKKNELLDKLPKLIPQHFRRSQISAGESVGILCGQSVGEKGTQSTLNSFHSTGLTIKTVVQGVPRISELLNATKDHKGASSCIFMKEPYTNTDLLSLQELTLKKLVNLNVKHLLEGYHLYHPSEWEVCFDKHVWIRSAIIMDKFNNDTDTVMDWSFTDMDHVLKEFRDECARKCFAIELKLKRSVIHKFQLDITVVKKKIKMKLCDCRVLQSPLSTNEVYILVFARALEDSLTYYHFIHSTLMKEILDVYVCGVPGVKNYLIQETDYHRHIPINHTHCILTEGSNFITLLNHHLFDDTLCYSNNMWEIYNTLGIEAVKNFLKFEFNSVLNNDGGSLINECHINLLVSVMTHTGYITSISRYGTRDKVSPLARASFEESLDNFIKAALYSERENARSVSSCVMLGKIAEIGTGFCDLLMCADYFDEDYDRETVQQEKLMHRLLLLDHFSSELSEEDDLEWGSDDEDGTDSEPSGGLSSTEEEQELSLTDLSSDPMDLDGSSNIGGSDDDISASD